MKILKVEIYSPDREKLREVNFNENGLSVIYGDVEKPKKNNEPSNSIGKTILLKVMSVPIAHTLILSPDLQNLLQSKKLTKLPATS